MKLFKLYFFIVLLVGLNQQIQAQVNNGGFEAGLTGWTTTGSVEALGSANFTPTVGPFEGSSFVLLSTGPGDNGGGDTGNDVDISGDNEFDSATLTQAFTAASAGSISFSIAGLATGEVSGGVDDVFEVRIDGNPVIQGSIPGVTGSPFADFGVLDSVSYVVASGGATNGSTFQDGITPSQQFSFNLTAGNHTIEFFIADEDDADVDSGLLIDNVQFSSNANATAIPTLSEWSMLLLILALGFIGISVARKYEK